MEGSEKALESLWSAPVEMRTGSDPEVRVTSSLRMSGPGVDR